MTDAKDLKIAALEKRLQFVTEERDESDEHIANTASKIEQERLRFEGELDKWMKIIGAGITGYQPEAYALMDLACKELVKLRAENEALRKAT